MSAGVRRATATHKSTSSSDLTQRRTTRTSTNATATTSAVTLDPPEISHTNTRRRNTIVKVVSDTFYGLKNKAVDQVSRAFRSKEKKASLASSSISITTGISTRSAVRTVTRREASSELESSPISTSVVSANLQLAESSQSPPSAPVVVSVVAPIATTSKTFLNEGLFSNVVSQPKVKYSRTSKTSRTIRAGKATAIEQASAASGSTQANRILPLPLHWGLRKMEERSEFLVPWDIMSEWQSGELDSQKSPTKYIKLRKNIFPERKARVSTEWQALCHCEPESGCGENCLNRAMNYLCGKNCPCGDKCTNGSLALRPQKETKIFWTGARGFGVQATEPIKEGQFVMDYRGEIIPMTTFYKRIRNEYNNRKDFYALSYDADEVIDAGLRGNEARFINHSCGPNLEVRKYQTMGNGSEEFEVGFWALRDIRAGEELSYNYNFDSFTTIKRPSTHPELVEATLQRRQRCLCGAPNCVGWLGKESAESSKTNPDENIAPELRGPAPAVANDASVPAPKKILLKLGGTPHSARGVKRQASVAAGSENITSPNKRPAPSVASRGKGKGKATASTSASSEAVGAQDASAAADGSGMIHSADQIPGQYLSAEHTNGELPVSSNLSSLLHHEGEGFVEDHYAVTGGFPAGEAYTEAAAYQDGMSFTEANPEEYAAEASAQLEFNQPKVSNRGKGVRVIEKHRRKTKYGLIWKSDAELELERRRRKKGYAWLEEQKAAVRRLHDALRNGEKVVPPPTSPPLPIRAPEAAYLEPTPRQRKMMEKAAASAAGGDTPEPSARASSHPKPSATPSLPPYVASSIGGHETYDGQADFRLEDQDLPLVPRSEHNTNECPSEVSDDVVEWQVASSVHGVDVLAWMEEAADADYQEPDQNGGYDGQDQHYSNEGYEANYPEEEGYGNEENHDPYGGGGSGGGPPGGDPGGNPGGDPWGNPDDGGPPSDDEDEEDDEEEDHDDGIEKDDNSRRQAEEHGIEHIQYNDNPGVADHDPSHGLALDSQLHLDPNPAAYEHHNGLPGDYATYGNPQDAAETYQYDESMHEAMQGSLDGDLENMDYMQHTPQDESHLNHEQRQELREERKRMREEAERTKKRRKKWILPLEEDAIESERRRKKKGLSWKMEMQQRAAAKRAEMGLVDAPGMTQELEIHQEIAIPDLPEFGAAEDLPALPGEQSGPSTYYHSDPAIDASLMGQADIGHVDQTADLDSFSDITDLEEMDTNEREIIKLDTTTIIGSEVGEEESNDGKLKRNRRPRPPRRFKTALTRIRPKLEAAIGPPEQRELNTDEEAELLEQERKRRKKGTAWLESMKALAKAQRLARQREAQGLPPQEFVLPPTSMTPSGKRKPKQPGATVKKRKRDIHTSDGFDHDIPALPDSIDLVSGPAEPRLDTQLDEAHGDDLPSLPRYAMFPSNDVGSVNAGSGFYAEGDERVYTHASESNYLESHLSAPVSGHVDSVPQEYAALMTGGGTEEAGHVEAHGPALQDPAYDPSAFGTDAASQQSIQHSGTYNQHAYGGHYHDYTSNLGNFGTLPLQTNTHYPLPAFQAFHDRAAQQQQHLSPVSPYGTPGHGQFMLSGQDQEHHSDLPPPPTSVAKTKSLHQKRRTDTVPGEKRKRGPAVKKLAADEGMPEWTDEQWEAERKKRKKGYGWVAETKAAAEAERQNRALKAAGLTVNNGRRPSKTLQELHDARAERLHHSHDDLSLQDDMHLQDDEDDVAQLQAQAQELEQQHQLEHQQQIEQAFDTVVHDAHFGVAETSLHDQEQAVAAAVAAHHQPADPFGTFSAVEASMIPYQTTEDAHFAANPDDYYNSAAPAHLHAAYTTDHMQDHMLQATHHFEDAQ